MGAGHKDVGDTDLTQTVEPNSSGWVDRPVAEEDLPVGQRLGRYVISGQLGSGGMGVVYRAHDPQLGRSVAIKVVRTRRRPAGIHGEDGKARLLREAQAMAKLAHPNVVTVYDVGLHEARLWIATELVDGYGSRPCAAISPARAHYSVRGASTKLVHWWRTSCTKPCSSKFQRPRRRFGWREAT